MPSIKRHFDSWDLLKLIGLGLMFTDHAGYFFFPEHTWLRAIGRGTAPIFFFLTGYAPRYRFKWELLLLALALTASDTLLAGGIRTQNVLVTILCCRVIFDILERDGLSIRRPYLWYIGLLFMLPSVAVMQYGFLGFMFAICGYVKKRANNYSPKLPLHFMVLVFATYGLYSWEFNDFTFIGDVLLMLTLSLTCLLCWKFKVRDINTPHVPGALLAPAMLMSRYSGYVYVIHLAALEWMTRTPF